jgi:hypothetical protein
MRQWPLSTTNPRHRNAAALEKRKNVRILTLNVVHGWNMEGIPEAVWMHRKGKRLEKSGGKRHDRTETTEITV